MTGWIGYLLVGGLIAGLVAELDDDYHAVHAALLSAAVWPAFCMIAVVLVIKGIAGELRDGK